MGIGLVLPVFPKLMHELNIDGKTVGFLTAMFALTQLLASPLTGKATDHFGRKIMIVMGLFIFGISELLFAMGNEVIVLFISRALGGISAACIMPAVSAFIADITTNETRPKAYGYMSAAISTGFIIGPGVGGFLADFGIRTPFYVAGALGILSGIISWIILREPKRHEAEEFAMVKNKGNIRKLLVPMFLMAFIVIFISNFGLMSFETFYGVFVDKKLGFSPRDIAISITGGAIIGAIIQIALFERLTRWLGEIKLIRYMLLFSAINAAVFPFLNSYAIVIISTMLAFIFFDLVRPAVTTYLASIAGPDQGFVGGMNSFFTSLANVIAPIICGILFDIEIAYPFYLAAITIAFGFVLAIFWKKPSEVTLGAQV
ncbi:MFS transporter [Paenibacillus turicensis]